MTEQATTREPFDTLWVDVRLATFDPTRPGVGVVDDGAVAAKDGRIAWVGARSELPGAESSLAWDVRPLEGRWMTPGLVDCHTHLVFAGSRAEEFGARLRGVGYEEIARAGGGILSTVRATREADEETLARDAARRAAALVREGVTTLEIKSGYGLDVESELRMLRAARRVGELADVNVRATLLAAHAVPPEMTGRPDAYVDRIVDDILPAAVQEGLAHAVDAFLEGIAFDAGQVDRVFEAAAAAGLPVRLHADQLADGGGAALAARHGALSADHLEHTSEEGVRAMARAGTTAVLCPGAFYVLRERRTPPVERFRAAGVPMAVATDANPGTSPLLSLLLAAHMGAVLFGLTPEEALAGITREAARALGLLRDRGTLEPGKRADLAVWDVDALEELVYWIGGVRPTEVVRGGRPVSTGGPA